jgi:hypothetical protein
LPVHIGFDGEKVLPVQRLGVAEVEAQPVRRHQGSFLRDVLAQVPPQSLMQKVGRRMVGPQVRPSGAVDPKLHHVAESDLAA